MQEHPLEQLAWLANGTLQEEERAAVEAHLAQCEACQEEYRLIRLLQKGLRKHWSAQEPGELGWARLRAAIHTERKTAQPVAQPRRWMAIAAGLLLGIQTVLIGWLWQGQEKPGYRPSSGETAITLQVRFRADATAGAISNSLGRLGLTVVEGPGALGIYRLRPVDPKADREALARALRETGLVKEVIP